ncbi:uncharacterized protein FFB20_07255 [Fusarium fujikuroi]|nr:uncharacterized protein LW93_12946 [Fusarium fujikuroi]KLP11860.1 uncharacterized protein Y057_4305 [Fusarium fujikuroi]SCN80136.1 uncharacterized protein FFC1_03435 [Fusarium fujikuroi]SCN84573.1 uncharacterized protein FFB20_07255 [Fusarium fujikuroi]SCO03704.1 uncharacterized protein FFE2_10407 [Fusarium fujikuroi]
MTSAVRQHMAQPVTAPMASFHRPARLHYLRGFIKNISSGVECCPSDNISDLLQLFFENAIAKGATAYIFGELRRDLKKINQIHMNQGSVGRFEHENAAGQDGGVLLQFPDHHWEALFIAFQEQGSRTNEDGQSIGPNLGSIVEYCKENPVASGTDAGCPPVGITALLYPDYKNPNLYPNAVPVCYLTISNIAKQDVVDLEGWEISSSESEEVHTIENVQLLPGGGRFSFAVPPKWFPGSLGAIFLRNREKETVDQVHYYREWKRRSGRLLYFGRNREGTFS